MAGQIKRLCIPGVFGPFRNWTRAGGWTKPCLPWHADVIIYASRIGPRHIMNRRISVYNSCEREYIYTDATNSRYWKARVR
jgi:hypothetical protein